MKNIKFLLAGLVFGIILVKSEVVSWFRIQEMFRLEAFHMYGVIGSAIATGMLSLFLIKHFGLRAAGKRTITVPDKKFHWGNVYGGLIFGLGWALTGACPGPMFALAGSGFPVALVMLVSAVAGTWVYGLLRDQLPH